MYPTWPSSIFDSTSWVVISSLVMARSSVRASRLMVSVTLVPDGPRTLLIWSWMVEPMTLLPSTAVTTSPGWRPARSAGEPEMGLTTTRTQLSESVAQAERLAGSLRFLTAISAPMPLNLPESDPSACW